MTNSRLIKLLDILSYVFLILSVVAVPLVIDKTLVNFYIIPKQYIFIGLLLFNIIFFALKIVLTKSILYRQSVLDIPLLIFLVVILTASIFSKSIYISFLGRSNVFLLNFVFLLFSVLFYFIFVNNIQRPRQWQGVLDVLVGVGGISALLFILKSIFSLNLPIIGSVWNVIDGSNSSFGVWLIAIFILSGGLLVKRELKPGKAIYYFFVFLLSFIPLLVIAFNYLWWLVLVGLILLLLLSISSIHKVRTGWISVLFAMLILTIVFIIFGSPKILQRQIPIEISLGAKSSWSITNKTIFSGAKNFLLGSGLGSFAADFSRYRTTDFNYDSMAWSLRFSQPFNTYFALLSEGGILAALSVVFIFFLVLGYILHSWFIKNKSSFGMDDTSRLYDSQGVDVGGMQHLDLWAVTIAWLVLLVGMAFNFFGPVLWYLWWLLLGLIISGLSIIGYGVLKEKSKTLADTPQYNLVFSFSLIVVIALVIMVGVLGVRFYWAEIVYAKALQSTDYKVAESWLKKSSYLHQSSDVYHVTLAKVYLGQATQEAQKQKPDLQGIGSLMSLAVNEARYATQLSPNVVSIWENLATMYENASALVPQAGDWAIKSLDQAVELEPTNAYLYWRLANNYALAKNYSKAIENFKKAINSKTDYVGAYIGLARSYEANNEVENAVETYKKGGQVGGANNAEFLYDYGRVLYNRNIGTDRKDAEQLWLLAVKLQPTYSNALYSLGLLYEANGDKTSALQYYYKVKDLNPNNNEIIGKINSVLGVFVNSTSASTSTKTTNEKKK